MYQPLIIYAKMKMISNLKMRKNLLSMRVGQSRVHHGVLAFIPHSTREGTVGGREATTGNTSAVRRLVSRWKHYFRKMNSHSH